MVDRLRLEQLRRRYRPALYPSCEELVGGLTSHSMQRFTAALEQAPTAGVEGERALVAALPRVPRERRESVVWVLRSASGGLPETEEALKALVLEASGPGSLDLRSAAIGALVARTGTEAVPLLVAVLREDGNGEIKDQALRCLAAVGDATAVPEARRRLRVLLRRPTRAVEGRITALAYLGQHPCSGSEEMAGVVESVRQHWSAVHPHFERPWVAQFWPDLAPDGPPADRVTGPDPAALRRWARSSLCLPTSPRVTVPLPPGTCAHRIAVGGLAQRGGRASLSAADEDGCSAPFRSR